MSTTPPTLGSKVFYAIEKIIVPKSSIDAYKFATSWSTYADKIVYEVDSSDLIIDVLTQEQVDLLFWGDKKTEYRTIKASEGKVFRRISDGVVFGKEINLGYTHYIGGKKLEEPLLELPEHFEEIDEPVREVNE